MPMPLLQYSADNCASYILAVFYFLLVGYCYVTGLQKVRPVSEGERRYEEEHMTLGSRSGASWVCRLCNENAKTKYVFKVHLAKKHSRWLCTECGKTYRSQGSLYNHAERLHRERLLECGVVCEESGDVCDASFLWPA